MILKTTHRQWKNSSSVSKIPEVMLHQCKHLQSLPPFGTAKWSFLETTIIGNNATRYNYSIDLKYKWKDKVVQHIECRIHGQYLFYHSTPNLKNIITNFFHGCFLVTRSSHSASFTKWCISSSSHNLFIETSSKVSYAILVLTKERIKTTSFSVNLFMGNCHTQISIPAKSSQQYDIMI
jgi:hypothetical protein